MFGFGKQRVAQLYRVDLVKQRLHGLNHIAAIRSSLNEDLQVVLLGVSPQDALLHDMWRRHRPALPFPLLEGALSSSRVPPVEELLHRTEATVRLPPLPCGWYTCKPELGGSAAFQERRHEKSTCVRSRRFHRKSPRDARSEERRVGKEWRSRGAPDH